MKSGWFLQFPCKMASEVFSSIYKDLDAAGKVRYREKLKRIGDSVIDPYLFCDDALPTSQYPLVEYGDIYDYLIDAPSPHTKEQLRHTRVCEATSFVLPVGLGTCVPFLLATTVELSHLRRLDILSPSPLRICSHGWL